MAVDEDVVDWRRRYFGDTLLPPWPGPDRDRDCDPGRCPVDVLAPPAPAVTQGYTVGVYFRGLPVTVTDTDTDTVTQCLRQLCEAEGSEGRLKVVQVILPPWLPDGSYPAAPWYTMPFDDPVKWVRLKHRLRARPGMLVLLCAHTGKVLVKDASHHLTEDPQGHHFPWLPRPIPLLLTEATQRGLIAGGLRKGPKILPYSMLEGCIKGLYFSAHWCPPCKAFTPQLIDCYRKIKSRGHKFEIIFVSSDRSEESYDSYLATMPWTALPYKSGFCQELAGLFDVHGIPTLVLLDTDGSLITDDGRTHVRGDLNGEFFPWRLNLVNMLTNGLISLLYDSPAVVLFVDGEDEDLDFAKAVLVPAAEWTSTRAPHLDYELLFFVAVENDASESIRSFTRLDDVSPLLTAIDFPLNRFSLMEYGAEITEQSVKTFVSDFIENKLCFKPISEVQITPSTSEIKQ